MLAVDRGDFCRKFRGMADMDGDGTLVGRRSIDQGVVSAMVRTCHEGLQTMVENSLSKTLADDLISRRTGATRSKQGTSDGSCKSRAHNAGSAADDGTLAQLVRAL